MVRRQLIGDDRSARRPHGVDVGTAAIALVDSHGRLDMRLVVVHQRTRIVSVGRSRDQQIVRGVYDLQRATGWRRPLFEPIGPRCACRQVSGCDPPESAVAGGSLRGYRRCTTVRGVDQPEPVAKRELPAENYGWPAREGTASGTCGSKQLRGTGELIGPAFEYDHDIGFTVIGGFVYRGSQMPGQVGRYFFGDLKGWVRAADAVNLNNDAVVADVSNLVSFGENSKGELYAVSLSGRVYKIVDN